MFSDDIEELHGLAERIGLKRSWFQLKPKPNGRGFPHYDLTGAKRAQALHAGAVSVERDEAVRLWRELGYL
jgi:hypothetical protein